MPKFETSIALNLKDLASLDINSARSVATKLRNQVLDSLFNIVAAKLGVDPDFPLDGINQYVHSKRLKMRHITAEMVDNGIDALTQISSDKDISEKDYISLKKDPSLINITIKGTEAGAIEFIISDNGDGFSDEFFNKLKAGAIESSKSSGFTALMGGAGVGIGQLISTSKDLNLAYEFTNNATGGAQVKVSVPLSKILTPEEYVQQLKENLIKKRGLFWPSLQYLADDNGRFVESKKDENKEEYKSSGSDSDSP
jgi:hypothetical protein